MLLLVLSLALAKDFRKRANQLEAQGYTRSDVEAEVLFGRELAVKIVGTHPLLRDEELTRYVNLVGRSLALYSNRPELEFRFGILDTEAVNAFSAPGGYIFITKGCLKLAKDESELAGIIAHEIAHVTERHIVRELNLKGTGDSPIAGLSAAISGPSAVVEKTISTFLDQAYAVLFEKGYKLQQEYDADRIGTQMLYLAGYDPDALKRFLQRVLDGGYASQMQKTHPNIEERVRALESFLQENQLNNKSMKRNEVRYAEQIKKLK